jgi:hypothetical protein
MKAIKDIVKRIPLFGKPNAAVHRIPDRAPLVAAREVTNSGGHAVSRRLAISWRIL